MNFPNFSAILTGLQNGLALAQALKPLASAAGVKTDTFDKVANLTATLLDTAQHVSEKVAEGKIVATSQDQDQLKGILASIQAENDALDKFIDEN